MVLVDTSVWVHHLRLGDATLGRLLEEGEVLCHPFVIGELACGNLSNRDSILSLLGALPAAVLASHEEALRLTQNKRITGKGLGWVDVHLLAAARLSNCELWTKDKALHAAAQALKVAH